MKLKGFMGVKPKKHPVSLAQYPVFAYLRWLAWREELMDMGWRNYEFWEEWELIKPHTAKVTVVLPEYAGTTHKIEVPDQLTGRITPQR